MEMINLMNFFSIVILPRTFIDMPNEIDKKINIFKN